MHHSSRPNFKKNLKSAATAAKLYQKKRLKEARKHVSFLLSSNLPKPETYFQVGVAASNAGDIAPSILLLEAALKLEPSDKSLYSNICTALGSAFTADQKYEKAISYFDQALTKKPENSGALNNRAIAFMKVGNQENALLDFEKAHSLALGNAGILLNYADLLVKTGKTEKALQLYNNNLVLHAENAAIHYAAGILKKFDSPAEALAHLRKAALLEPENSQYLLAYSEIFQLIPNLNTFDGLENDLLLLFSSNSIPWNNLNRATTQHIKSLSNFREIRPYLIAAVQKNVNIQLEYQQTINALTNNLFLAALKRIRLPDPEIEKLLEIFRQQTLTALVSEIKIEPPLFELLRAILTPLAHYCFSAEYVFVETESEKQLIDQLIQSLEVTDGKSEHELILKTLMLACYRPLYRTPCSAALLERLPLKKDTALAELIQTVINEPLQEAESYSQFPQLTPINDNVSLSVQAQYEENPYPRWSHLHYAGSSSYSHQLAQVIPKLKGKTPNFPSRPKVLIAGCGTGRQPISTARSFPETDVLAVDLSLASLGYAKRKTVELNVPNITYGQADIMELGKLDRRFHIIECAGVLHHMKDPVAGWRILCDLLEDNGYMLIGLYSDLGRSDVVASREFIQENGYSDTLDNIRDCRKALMALGVTHPAQQIALHSDFYTTSACRDLIFHVQEHRFTIPELEAVFEELGLEFLGFNSDLPRTISAYKEMFPDDPDRTNLKNWQILEEKHPRTFATMYKFWVRKRK